MQPQSPLENADIAYGLMQFIIRSKEESVSASVLFDDSSRLVCEYLRNMFEGNAVTSDSEWRRFRSLSFSIDSDSEVFGILIDRLLFLIGRHESLARYLSASDVDRAVENFFAPFVRTEEARQLSDFRVREALRKS